MKITTFIWLCILTGFMVTSTFMLAYKMGQLEITMNTLITKTNGGEVYSPQNKPIEIKTIKPDHVIESGWVLFVSVDGNAESIGMYHPVETFKTKGKCEIWKWIHESQYKNYFWCENLPVHYPRWGDEKDTPL